MGDSGKYPNIEIRGDETNQKGIRFCVFQLHQTLHTAEYGAVFGAKGLTGEAYNGNTFWDSEVCCLPLCLFNNPAAAKSFLKSRYDTLPQAKERAAALNCEGGFCGTQVDMVTGSGRQGLAVQVLARELAFYDFIFQKQNQSNSHTFPG